MFEDAPISSAPGPSPIRGLGAAANLIVYMRNPVKNAGRIFARYGNIASLVRAPIHVASPGPGWGKGPAGTAKGAGVVLVTGADNNREILTQHDRFHMIALPGRLRPVTPPTSREKPIMRMMTGLFQVNGDEHRRHRRLLMPAFHKSRIDGYQAEMARITEEIVSRYRNGETRDVHADMTELTLRVATQTLFGADQGERGTQLARMMQEWLLTMFNPVMMFLRFDVPGTPYRKFLDLTAAIDRETAAIVRDKRVSVQKNGGGSDMLSMLLAAQDDDGTGFDEDDLIGHTGVIFAAGHETSTNALAWTLFLLSQHPHVLRDLEDELAGVLRGGAPSVEDLGKLPLLDAVVKESMRVLPPVPMHPRIVAEDCELGGHSLPAGSELFISIYHMHHDPAVFSEPEAFDPRRWETIKPSVYEYNPFSAGPRMCIGASFAIMEIKTALAILLQRHRLELPARALVDPRVAITMAPAGGLPMLVRGRGHSTRAPGGVRGRVREMVRLGN